MFARTLDVNRVSAKAAVWLLIFFSCSLAASVVYARTRLCNALNKSLESALHSYYDVVYYLLATYHRRHYGWWSKTHCQLHDAIWFKVVAVSTDTGSAYNDANRFMMKLHWRVLLLGIFLIRSDHQRTIIGPRTSLRQWPNSVFMPTCSKTSSLEWNKPHITTTRSSSMWTDFHRNRKETNTPFQMSNYPRQIPACTWGATPEPSLRSHLETPIHQHF